MNPKELRLGNLIRYNSGYEGVFDLPVEAILDGRVNVYYRGTTWSLKYDEVEGVPLTPELLEKCGFDRLKNEYNIDGIEMRMQINGYDRDGSWYSSCGKLQGGLVVMALCRGNYFSNNMEYLHELQNQFYALEGRELTINL